MLTSPSVTYSAAETPDWQPYRFSGKESLTRVGLDLYDFGARMFSPLNMRWMTMDPLCERAAHISPYAYCSGNPINRIDMDGMFDKKMFWSGVGAIVKGTVEIAAGGVMLSTGVGAGAAAYLLPVGIASVGAGGALIIGGVSIDDNCENADTATKILKDGPVMSIARACDMATKTETPYFEIGASLFETAFGVATFEVSSNMVVIASDILTIEQGRETFTLIINNTSANNTNSDVELLPSENEEIMKFF
jgi:RHS repeat-associated protein